MRLKENKRVVTKFSLMLSIFFVFIFLIGGVSASHTSTVELQPEWSVPNSVNDYTVTFTNDASSPDAVGEVRIYKNDNYDDFVCDDKTGWFLSFPDPDHNICNYRAIPRDTYKILPGHSETFTFSAKSPEVKPDQCGLIWQFETRDITFPNTGSIQYLSDTTKIDDEPPETKKTLGYPSYTDGPLEWISTSTPITLDAQDMSETCAIGVDKTWYRNDLADTVNDGVGENFCLDPSDYCNSDYITSQTPYGEEGYEGCIDEVQRECSSSNAEGSSEWLECVDTYVHQRCQVDSEWKLYDGNPFTKDEESCHVLQYFSVDKLGNTENTKFNCFYVDNTPPEVSLSVGDPQSGDCIDGNSDGDRDCYVQDHSTQITLSCKDQDPHPSNNVKIYYKILLDGNLYQDWSQYTSPFAFDEDSQHTVEYYCGDAVGNSDGTEADPHSRTFLVDSTPPAITKTMLGTENQDWLGDCPPEPGSNDECYVRDTGADSGLITYWTSNIGPSTPGTFFRSGTPFNADLGSGDSIAEDLTSNTANLQITSSNGNYYDLGFYVFYGKLGDLNNLPIEGTGPFAVNLWIDKDKNGEFFEWNGNALTGLGNDIYGLGPNNNGGSGLTINDATSFQSITGCGTKTVAELKAGDCSGVDSDTPVAIWVGIQTTGSDATAAITSFNGKPMGQVAGVSVNVRDGGEICAVGQVTCTYNIVLDNEDTIRSGQFTDTADISFTEDSSHTLNVHCEDALGNSVEDVETFLVDSTPPVTIKSFTGPQYPDDNDQVGILHYINSQTFINLDADDNKVGVAEKRYRVSGSLADKFCNECGSWMNVLRPDMGDWNTYNDPFTIPEQSCHVIEYSSVDKLGNTEDIKWQCVFVDNTGPTAEKRIGDPNKVIGDKDYVTEDTPITITCTDQNPHPVDHSSLSYRYRYSDDCDNLDSATWGDWMAKPEGQTEIKFTEDSCHEVEYKCVDSLGNEGQTYDEIDVVDSQPPEITKVIDGPHSGTCPPEDGQDCYITNETQIQVSAIDPEPHPVGDVQCEYFYYLDNDKGTKLGFVDDTSPPFTIQFPEESTHELHIKCWDALGNSVEDVETFLVDLTPPEIIKTYENPHFPFNINDGAEYPHYISSLTDIIIDVEDDGPHKTGIDETKYRYKTVDDKYCWDDSLCQEVSACSDDGCWTPLNDPAHGEFNIPEESCHVIEIRSTDVVGNEAKLKQCVFVDNTPPTPTKTVGDPKTEWYPVDVADDPFDPDATQFYGSDNPNGDDIVDKCWNDPLNPALECWKVTLDTKISMDCEDQDPHPVDHEQVCFNVEMDGEDITNGDGCGFLQFGKCGKPEGYCSEYGGKMICAGWNWKVNGYTNYDECIQDQGGEDYCCVDHTIDNFHFLEESEHDLKYYCTDALGNSNENDVDDEKFKVTGNLFKIKLNDKWNLISVPFRLLNDDPSEVFKNTGSVKTVYGYNSETKHWSVYRPESEGPNDLNEIVPGLGYWVLADCEPESNPELKLSMEDYRNNCDSDKCEMLVVGGSLYNPGPIAPPSQNLQKGWNLIGYYGTEGRYGYFGPDFPYWKDSKDRYCALYSLRDGEVNNLQGYWEPYNPDQWEDYYTCDEMDPGAGYWVDMNNADLYTPPSGECETPLLSEIGCGLHLI